MSLLRGAIYRVHSAPTRGSQPLLRAIKRAEGLRPFGAGRRGLLHRAHLGPSPAAGHPAGPGAGGWGEMTGPSVAAPHWSVRGQRPEPRVRAPPRDPSSEPLPSTRAPRRPGPPPDTILLRPRPTPGRPQGPHLREKSPGLQDSLGCRGHTLSATGRRHGRGHHRLPRYPSVAEWTPGAGACLPLTLGSPWDDGCFSPLTGAALGAGAAPLSARGLSGARGCLPLTGSLWRGRRGPDAGVCPEAPGGRPPRPEIPGAEAQPPPPPWKVGPINMATR